MILRKGELRMVESVNGQGAPKGYTTVKLYDNKTKKTESFYIPIGKKFYMNGKEYDPSKGKNNEFVVTGTKGQAGFDNVGIALRAMDVNNDGNIDMKDSSSTLARSINSTLAKGGSSYYVKDVKDVFSDAGLSKGTGGVVFSKDGEQRMEFGIY